MYILFFILFYLHFLLLQNDIHLTGKSQILFLLRSIEETPASFASSNILSGITEISRPFKHKEWLTSIVCLKLKIHNPITLQNI